MTTPATRPFSVRAILLLMAAGAGLYVAALGAYAVLGLEPAARALRVRAGTLATEYDSLRVQTATLERAVEELRRLSLGRRQLTPEDRREVSSLRQAVATLAAQTAGVQSSAALKDIPPRMRVSLAEAAGIESRLAGVLLEALEDLDLGDSPTAASWIAHADTAREQLVERLGDAQRLGLVDLSEREHLLGERATRVGQGVVVWVVLGTALVGLAMLVLRRRLYAPLSLLDVGLEQVARGDLQVSLPVRRNDELGRLTEHFNEMTSVLRARPEVEALRRSEVRFRSLIEHGMDLTTIIGADGRIRYSSPTVTRVLGYGPTELIGQVGFEYLHPDDSARVRAAFAKALGGATDEIREEFRFRHRDGSWRYFESVVTNLVDEPTVAGLVINSRDITERRQAEETLRRERFLVDTLMEHVPDFIYFKDAESRFLRINRAFAQRVGLRDPAEAVGKTDYDLFARDHADAAWRDEQEIIRSGRPVLNLEERETWTDRPSAWVSTTKMPLRDAVGRVVGTFGISRDITERKEAQLALQESETRFRTAFMTVADAHYIATRDDGRILEVNDRFEDVFGYAREEALGRTSLELGLYVNPEDRSRMVAELRLKGQVRELELLARRKGGEIIPVQISVSELAMGDQPLILGVVRNLTAQKRAGEALKDLEEQFRQAQRLEAVGRLAGGVAHDFNNILTAISGYTELLLEDFRGNDPRRADLEEIRSAAQRAAALTRQLLAFSRKQVLQPRVLALNEVVEGLEKMLRRLIGEDVTLELALGTALGAVRADPGQIEQVILNLAVNARDAMQDGGRLTIETANVELDAADAGEHADAIPGPYVMLAVSDTGTGMSAEIQSHIFEPFFTTKELGKGTGLGLATVHGIVTQSGGRVLVYSEPGQGTTFKILLPRVEPAAEDATNAPAPRPVEGGRETVLVAEDDAAVREVVAKSLTNRGYTVLRAPDGQTALEMAHGLAGRVDLLLTDIVMPGITGRELAQTLAVEHPKLRVLFMSGYTDDAVVRRGVLEEGMPFLQKPFTSDALALKVREVLDRK
jgi:PAS domain S-box-containing protein